MNIDKKALCEKIKAANNRRLLTNCYSMDVIECCQGIWAQGDEFIFSYEDHGIQRLVFFAKEWESVDRMLAQIGGGRFFLEFITKEPNEYVPNMSTQVAAMMRLSNPHCQDVFEVNSPVIKYKGAVAVESAREHDTKEINEILWSTFHTEISHLLSDKELIERIKAGQLTIHRNAENRIDAILQADVKPRKFYINQIVNKSDREVIHAILLDRLEKYIESGGRYLYAWVDNKNVASIKFHEKYGMKHDGLWSMIYCIER